MNQPFQSHMQAALDEAQKAAERGEVPVGAVILHKGEIIARAGNEVEARCDPSAHAEILAIRAACERLASSRLIDCDLYVTLEPCPMCAQAISFARIRRLYFAAHDPKGGAIENGPRLYHQPSCHHRPETYGGIEEAPASLLLKAFFQARRS